MTKRSLVAGLLLCLSLLSLSAPGRAEEAPESEGDAIAKMESVGWQVVEEGVLRREPRPNEVETFVFGVEGFTWKLRDLRGQLEVLRREHAANPTPELRRAIASHRKVIASTLKMIERSRPAAVSAKTVLANCQTAIGPFSYDADAGAKTERQGTWANASADFHAYPRCDQSGEVYAYAFAKTTVSGAASTMTVTDGPRSGSDVNAKADANRNGGSLCESNAYASVTSLNLNPTSYSKSVTNESCAAPSSPASALQASVTSNQPSTFTVAQGTCVTINWTVNISGGTSPYNTKIYRNNVFNSYGTTYSETVCHSSFPQIGSITILAEVVDRGGQSRSASHTTAINYEDVECNPLLCSVE